MPRSFTVERENLPDVVQGWLRAVKLADLDVVEIIFTDSEILLRRPASRQLREWARGVTDQYDEAFRELAGLKRPDPNLSTEDEDDE